MNTKCVQTLTTFEKVVIRYCVTLKGKYSTNIKLKSGISNGSGVCTECDEVMEGSCKYYFVPRDLCQTELTKWNCLAGHADRKLKQENDYFADFCDDHLTDM